MGAAAAVISAVATASSVFSSGLSILGVSILAPGLGSAVLAFAGSLAFSFVTGAFSGGGKTEAPDVAPFSAQSRNRTQTIRQPIVARRTIIGETKVGGALTFYETTSNNRYHHLVITLCDGPIEEIRTVYLNNTPIYSSQIDANGDVTSGDFSGKVRIKKHLGETDQAADSDLISEISRLDSNFRGRGVAYLYVRIDWDRDKFPNGLPNVSAVIRGAKLYDPRTDTTAWTPNAILALRNYLLDTRLGLGAVSTELSSDFSTEANVCEEIVATLSKAQDVNSVATGSPGVLTLANDFCEFQTGDRVEVSSTGTIPPGLAASTPYYVIIVQEALSPKIQLASTYLNAIAGTGLSITDSGSGTITVTRTGEPRYTANGVISSDRSPEATIHDLLTGFAGDLYWSGGVFIPKAGAFVAATTDLTLDDVIDVMSVQTAIPRRERYNTVQGVYVSPINDYQSADYPLVTNSDYVTSDNGETIRRTFDLPFTSRAATAQRVAKTAMEDVRREDVIEIASHLKAAQIRVGDTVTFTDADLGYSSQTFKVISWVLTTKSEGDGAATLIVAMRLKEIDALLYTWDETQDETAVSATQRSTLPDPFTVTAPTGLTLSSGTADLYKKKDGTIVSRIRVTWTDSVDALVTGYELQYKRSSDTDYLAFGFVDTGVQEVFIWDVEDGDNYDVRIRAINTLNVRSSFASETDHTVIGKTEPPSDVSSLSAQQNGNVVTFRWDAVSDTDRTGYELRYMLSPFVWNDAIVLSRETKGTLITNAGLPPGSWVVGIKAIDTSGNYSVNAATTDITVSNENSVITTITDTGRWEGLFTGFVRHDVSGTLIPDSNTLAADMTDAQLWDQMVYDPVAEADYYEEEADLTKDGTVRIWGELSGVLGAGETGVADPILSIDYRKAADPYDGYEDWSVGVVEARYILARARIKTASGTAALSGLSVTVDKEFIEDTGAVTAEIGGTSVTFSKSYFNAPNLQVTAKGVGGAARYATYENLTATGFDVFVFNSSGTDVGGDVTWSATGV